MGAPFAPNGLVIDDKVMCPYHAASYSVVTGVSENGPGQDGLETYQVVTEKGRVFALVPEVLKQSVGLPLTKRDPNDKRNFVIIGAGPAGLTCAETLRQSGYGGEITLINGDDMLPYDRTKLTKALPTGNPETFVLRDEQFFKDADIRVVKDKVYSIHTDQKKIAMVRGKPISYDKVLIATGGTPRKPEIPGADAKHVYYLRSAKDALQIQERAKGVSTAIVVVGGGFIGSESAASLAMQYKQQCDVHLVTSLANPLERLFGKEVGEMMSWKHEQEGVKLHVQSGVREILRDDAGNVSGVVLTDGTRITCGMVIIGAGITPATAFLSRTENDIKLDEHGAVICDPFLQSSNRDIFAAGDVASFPFWQTGKRIRVDHWINAQDTGSYAAFNMLGKFIPFGNTPVFWGRHYNKTIQFVGHCDSIDEVLIDGDTKAHKFIGYHFEGDRVCGVSAQGRYKDMLTLFEAFNQNKMPSASAIKSGLETPQTIARKLKERKDACVNCRCKKQANLAK